MDLMVETDPDRDYYVRSKKRLSAFYPTDLEFLSRQLGVRNLVITGTLTDCCMLNAAFDAANRGFRVIVPRDVAAGLSSEMEGGAHVSIATPPRGSWSMLRPCSAKKWSARVGLEPSATLAGAKTADELAALSA